VQKKAANIFAAFFILKFEIDFLKNKKKIFLNSLLLRHSGLSGILFLCHREINNVDRCDLWDFFNSNKKQRLPRL